MADTDFTVTVINNQSPSSVLIVDDTFTISNLAPVESIKVDSSNTPIQSVIVTELVPTTDEQIQVTVAIVDNTSPQVVTSETPQSVSVSSNDVSIVSIAEQGPPGVSTLTNVSLRNTIWFGTEVTNVDSQGRPHVITYVGHDDSLNIAVTGVETITYDSSSRPITIVYVESDGIRPDFMKTETVSYSGRFPKVTVE